MEISWRYLIGFERWRRFEMHAVLRAAFLDFISFNSSACVRPSLSKSAALKRIVAVVTVYALLGLAICLPRSASATTLEAPPINIMPKLLDVCRSKGKETDQFWEAYCFGYINSKVERLDMETIIYLDNKRVIYNRKYGPEKIDLSNMIFCNLQKKNLYNRMKKKAGNQPVTSEGLFDYLIRHVVYTERCSL